MTQAQIDAYLDELFAISIDESLTEQERSSAFAALATAALLGAFFIGAGPNVFPSRSVQTRVAQASRSARTLSSDIEQGRYSEQIEVSGTVTTVTKTDAQGKRELRTRLDLWGISVEGAFVNGQVKQPPRLDREAMQFVEVVMRWDLGIADHCASCLGLNGLTLTASEWDRLGIEPKDPSLICTGINCKCSLTPTLEESQGFSGAQESVSRTAQILAGVEV